MVNVEFDAQKAIAILSPTETLHSDDFAKLAEMIDPYIAEHGKINGLIIYTENFPGWEDFSAFISHIRFVNQHEKHISKVALVSEATILDFTAKIANHFVDAEIATFDYKDLDAAKTWMTT